jgi:hypothetical protein
MMHNFWLALIESQASVRENISNLAHLRMRKQDKQISKLMCSSAGEWHT